MSLLALVIYGTGAWRRRHRTPATKGWRHAAFVVGLAAIFIALQSPVDPIAERAFWMHQVQHLLLRMLGPFLIMLSAPQTIMTAGLPETIRRGILVPLVGNRWVRGFFGFFAHPVIATGLFIFTLVFWQVPGYHNLALRNEPLHYLMHISMLWSGLFFWWRVLDFRPRPLAAPFAARFLMLWIALAANIALGAYLFFKQQVLYRAYDDVGRLWDLGALADERAGALIIWLPGSMMTVIGILVVLGLWLRHERLTARRNTASPDPDRLMLQTSQNSTVQADRNRGIALSLAAFVLLIVVILITLGLLIRP